MTERRKQREMVGVGKEERKEKIDREGWCGEGECRGNRERWLE